MVKCSSIYCIKNNATVLINFRTQPAAHSQIDDISEKDTDILSYIAGYILRRTKSHPEASAFQETNVQPNTPNSLIAAYDRGGLIVPSHPFVNILKELELAFRRLPVKSISREAFFTLADENGTFAKMRNFLNNTDTTVENQEQFFVSVLNLFFTLRAHQKCRQIVENQIKQKHISRKSKALRETLNV